MASMPTKLFNIVVLFLCVSLGLAGAARAADITGVEVTQGKASERIALIATGELAHTRIFKLTSPNRVVVDFPLTRGERVQLPANYSGQFLIGLRFARFNDTTSRLVLDVKQPVEVKGSYAVPPKGAGDSWRYVLDIAAMGGAKPSGDATNAATPAVVEEVKKPLIVIDAGHGGQDPGAISPSKTYEKNITLHYAKAVRNALLRTGRYRVLLTREDDRFIMLGDRIKIAREAKGDVFLSLHADSNPRREAQGFSVYTLSETASDEEAAALAAQENKSDIIGGLDLNVQDEDVANILIDLAQRETMNKSSVLADTVLENLHPKVRRLPQPHRYAGFRVLKAPDVPSILMELGFLTNETDERLLKSREYEDIFSQSMVRALDAYFAKKPSGI